MSEKLKESVVYDFELHSSYLEGTKTAKLVYTPSKLLLISFEGRNIRLEKSTIDALVRIQEFLKTAHQFTVDGSNRVPIIKLED